MSPVTLAKLEGLRESVISLARQMTDLQQLVSDGVQRWGGQTTRSALVQTAKALLHDVGSLVDMTGADEWTEKHRQNALEILREYEKPTA